MPFQTTSSIIMIRPAAFGFNAETASNNTFQQIPQSGAEEVQQQALEEFDKLVSLLRIEGIDVKVIDDTKTPVKPDAIFPNNWISFHDDGTIVTYPMYSPLRRQERRDDVINELSSDYTVKQRISMEDRESKNTYLEGTGSMVLDRENLIAYACISPRTDLEVLEQWCTKMGYTPFSFAAQYDGQDIYHTNVMMAIGDGLAIVCLDVVEASRREALHEHLLSYDRDVVLLREEQIGSFAGNMLALQNKRGEQLMVMSATAHQSLDARQLKAIQSYARIVSSDIHIIESIGGGSVRCMIAENFLPHI
jgi:hypothetical protein